MKANEENLPLIRNSSDINNRLAELRMLSLQQEQVLKADVIELKESIKPANVIRNTIKNLGKDPEFESDAIKGAISASSGFLVDKLLFRKGFGWKSYLLNMGVKKALSWFLSKKKNLSFHPN